MTAWGTHLCDYMEHTSPTQIPTTQKEFLGIPLKGPRKYKVQRSNLVPFKQYYMLTLNKHHSTQRSQSPHTSQFLCDCFENTPQTRQGSRDVKPSLGEQGV